MKYKKPEIITFNSNELSDTINAFASSSCPSCWCFSSCYFECGAY